MSIIERAAALLRSEPQDQQSRPAASDKGETHRRDLLERVSADLAQVTYLPTDGASPPEPAKTNTPARSASRTARPFAVDRNRQRALGLITPDGERTPLAESFRRIKRQILANVENPKPGAPPANLVVVTSALAGEGKTFCTINLAISMALERDRTVLLVDADVAKPSVPRALGLHAEGGLMEVLLDRHVDVGDVLWKTDIGRLTVLPAGRAHQHATELLASDAMRELLRHMAERYHDRIVVFDSPPLLAASEAGALASLAGQIVVVVEAGKTSEAALKQALGRIDTSRVTGLLLNKVENAPLEYGYDAYGG
jgi:exopolysaccharide/PEP-CTERM locus tyrosine autokinase